MRVVIALTLVLGLSAAAVAPLAAAGDTGSVVAMLQQPGQYDVDINVASGGDWWTNPVWIGVGVVALILLIVIVALAARGGGGTTIIKE